jgi:hypothetical protein
LNTVSEEHIVINNVVLTPGMSLVVRLALTKFEQDMQAPGVLGHDEIGVKIANMYAENATKTLKIIFKKVLSDL